MYSNMLQNSIGKKKTRTKMRKPDEPNSKKFLLFLFREKRCNKWIFIWNTLIIKFNLSKSGAAFATASSSSRKSWRSAPSNTDTYLKSASSRWASRFGRASRRRTDISGIADSGAIRSAIRTRVHFSRFYCASKVKQFKNIVRVVLQETVKNRLEILQNTVNTL